MRMRRAYRRFWTAMLLLIVLSIFSAFAAANTVLVSGAEDRSFGISANDLKPPECGALNLTNIVTGSGNLQGSNGNDLILGSASADRINAKKGNDCVVGGDGGDELRGGDEDDVLLGGPGEDDLQGEKGQDTCYGGSGNDTNDGSCEVMYGIP
jgi:Ca2+-binding RTX toxin-like protein